MIKNLREYGFCVSIHIIVAKLLLKDAGQIQKKFVDIGKMSHDKIFFLITMKTISLRFLI